MRQNDEKLHNFNASRMNYICSISGCDLCQEIRFGECPEHGPLPSLRDSIDLSGNVFSFVQHLM